MEKMEFPRNWNLICKHKTGHERSPCKDAKFQRHAGLNAAAMAHLEKLDCRRD